MTYNQEQPVLEKEERAIVRAKSVDNDKLTATDKDIFFAKERYKLHQTMPDEGVTIEILEKYFFKKYGF